MIQTKAELKEYIKADRQRNHKPSIFDKIVFNERFLLIYYLKVLRVTEYHKNNQDKSVVHRLFYKYNMVKLSFLCDRLGIGIAPNSCGPGLCIYHPIGVRISYDAKIGKNLTIRQGCIIGNSFADQKAPTIGDDVNLSLGCKIIGKVTVGRGAWVDCNAVVMKNVPPYAIVMGVPAKVVSFRYPPEEIVEREKKTYPPEERIPLEVLQNNYKKYYKDRLSEIKRILK